MKINLMLTRLWSLLGTNRRLGRRTPTRHAAVVGILASILAAPFHSILAQSVPAVSIEWSGNEVRVVWPNTGDLLLLEHADSLAESGAWQPATDSLETIGDQTIATIDVTESPRFFRLRSIELTRISESSPVHGESGVAVTRETIFRFNHPLATNTFLGNNHLYAEAAGRRLLTRLQLSSDRKTVTLFYLEPIPGSARVTVTFDASGLWDEFVCFGDLEKDGRPGGVARLSFDTLSVTPIPATAVIGTVFASEQVPGSSATNFVNVPLAGVTITVDGMEESMRAVTDANGFFRLQPCPAGEFFVHIDGRTVTNLAAGIHYPDQAYYPFVGKSWKAVAGVTTNLAGETGLIYLPLIAAGTLQPVSATEDTIIRFPPSVIAKNPALASAALTVPANSLYNDNGTGGGRVGIAPVPSDRLPGPLPPGLELPLVFTVQTDGPLNFDRPVPICLPNLVDPVLGTLPPPGSKQALVSFSHDKGVWEAVGTMTVSEDGMMVCTDPGSGVLSPGWGVNTTSAPGRGIGAADPSEDEECDDFEPNRTPFDWIPCTYSKGAYCEARWGSACRASCTDCIENESAYARCLARCLFEHAECLRRSCFSRGFRREVQDQSTVLLTKHFFAIEDLLTGSIVLRGEIPAGGTGHREQFFLPVNRPYRYWVVDPNTLRIGSLVFGTPPDGQSYTLPPVPVWHTPSPVLDTDMDELSDEFELVIGTNPGARDSDGDSIPDGMELRRDTNPLDGRLAIQGIVASVVTARPAVEVFAANDLASVAMGTSGVGVFDISSGGTPLLLAQLDTPGQAQSVAASDRWVVVADGTAGAAIINVATPERARISHQLALPGDTRVVVGCGSMAFAGSSVAGQDEYITQIDLETGTIVRTLRFGGFPIQDLLVRGDYLYVLQTGRDGQFQTLRTIPIRDGHLTLEVHTLNSQGVNFVAARMRLALAGDVLISTHAHGYNSFSLANPAQPTLLQYSGSNGDLIAMQQILPSGAQPTLMVSGRPNEVNLKLVDFGDWSGSGVFLTQFTTSGRVNAASLYRDRVYVADDAGLQVVNYRQPPLANPGDPGPAFAIRASFPLTPPSAEAGRSAVVTAEIAPEAQVRDVEFWVDDALVARDGNYPFEFCFHTPPLSPGQPPQFVVAVRVTDTSGRSRTESLTVALTGDQTPPRVTDVTPSGGGKTVTQAKAQFTEDLDPNTLTLASYQLTAAGLDGLLDTPDDSPVAGGAVDYAAENHSAVMSFGSPLPDGLYRATLRDTIRDRSGNLLPHDFHWTFVVADAVFWTHPFSGLWNEPSNWSTGVVPGPEDRVVILATGSALGSETFGPVSVTLGNSTVAVRSLLIHEHLQLVNNATLIGSEYIAYHDGLSVLYGTIRGSTLIPSGPGALVIGNAILDGVTLQGDLELTALPGQAAPFAQIENGLTCSGTIRINGGVLTFSGDQTLGGANIVFGPGPSNGQLQISQDTTLTIDSTATLRGYNGFVGFGSGARRLINRGLIVADNAAGTLIVDGAALQNEGVVRAAGGKISIRNTIKTADLGSLETTGGQIELRGTLDNTGATLALNDTTGGLSLPQSTIRGGMVTQSGVGKLIIENAILNGVTLQGDLELTALPGQGAPFAQIENGLTCSGAIRLNGGVLSFSGDQTFGGANIEFGPGPSNGQLQISQDSTLTIDSTATLRGHNGFVGSGSGARRLINRGRISANQPAGVLTVLAAEFLNDTSGILEATANNAVLRIRSEQFTDNGSRVESNGGQIIVGP